MFFLLVGRGENLVISKRVITMAISQKLKDDIRAAVLAGREPRRTRGNQTILPLARIGDPGRYVVLSRADGLTEAGQFYYGAEGPGNSQQAPTLAFDPNQSLQYDAKGNAYIIGRDRKRILVRRTAADGTHRVTRIGERFFAQTKTEYIVSIPVRIEGRRKNGTTYTRYDHLPVDLLNTRRIMVSRQPG